MPDFKDNEFDDFRERPSWRDKDRRRDRSRHVPQGDMGGGSSPWMRKQILREAERLFQGGVSRGKKADPAQEKARGEIHRYFGTAKFSAAIKRYIKQYGMPEDWSTLMLLADSKEPATVMEAMRSLAKLYPNQGLQEQQGLRSKLNIIAMTTKDETLRLFAEETVAGL
ncbi:MAG: hypothetical protein AB1640_17540 [bacterium]